MSDPPKGARPIEGRGWGALGLGYRAGPMAAHTTSEINRWVGGFDKLYGLEILECTPTGAAARVEVRDDLKQPAGLVHGGVFASIAEGLTSLATAAAVYEHGQIAMGQSNSTSFLRPVLSGAVTARATRIHGGKTTWVWDVSFTDDDGRLCAVTRMTIAVRSQRR